MTKKIKSAVTDTENSIHFDPITKPGVSNLLSLMALASARPMDEVVAGFAGQGYGALKTEVAEALVALVSPIRTTTHELLADPGELDRLLAQGAEKAAVTAEATLARAHAALGLLPRAS
jgi:tryptophanyl-tRNA synthetase